jgi:sulfatase-like protein
VSRRPEPLWWFGSTGEPARPVAPARPRWGRRQQRLDAVACLSLSTLCFSRARRETLFHADWGFYHEGPLGATALAALVLNIVALAAVGFLCTQAIRRVRRPTWRRLAAGGAAAAVLISLNYARITHERVGDVANAIGRPALLALVMVALASSLRWPRPALHAIRGLALVASPLVAVTLGHGLWTLLEASAGHEWRSTDPSPLARSAPSLRRVVWLVFGELDQRVTFEARPAGLELPELDRFRRESLYADAAHPPAGTPEVSMPALVTGRPVVAVAPTSPNDLELTFADGKAARWSAQPNVFSRARTLGYDTALVGWHLPYPRVLGGSLGAADWRPSVAREQTRGDTLGLALRNQWGSLIPPANVRRLSAQRLADLWPLAIRRATDGRFGLVLLHLPLPGPPGIYDRGTGRLTAWNFTGVAAGYLDNLALADRLLGDLRRALDRTHLGDRTWIVVTSDGWWRASPRYDGLADHRVPFLVRPPDGGRGAHVDAPFNTVGTHDLILAILRGSVSDTRDAAAWLARHPVTPPKGYTPDGRPVS